MPLAIASARLKGRGGVDDDRETLVRLRVGPHRGRARIAPASRQTPGGQAWPDGHSLAYFTVNLLLVAIWYATSAGFFWPVFPIFGWGIGLAFNAWDVLWPAAEQRKIEQEMERLRRSS